MERCREGNFFDRNKNPDTGEPGRVNIGEKMAKKYFSSLSNWSIRQYGFNEEDAFKSDDKISMNGFLRLPEVIRKTPDKIVFHHKFEGKIIPYFLEVKTGRETIGIKFCDIRAIKKWCKFSSMDCIIFAYSTYTRQHYSGLYNYWKGLITDIKPPIKRYHDNNKRYFDIPVDKIY
mgnify:FL=1